MNPSPAMRTTTASTKQPSRVPGIWSAAVQDPDMPQATAAHTGPRVPQATAAHTGPRVPEVPAALSAATQSVRR